MKILHIYKDYYPILGGMENHVKLLAEYQTRRGHSVTVIVTHPTARTRQETINGVRIIKAGRLCTVASTPISLSLPILVAREKAHIAHLHSPYPVGELSQLFFGKAAKVILTYHSDIVRQKGLLRLYKPFLKAMLAKADRIIATSENYIKTSPHLGPFTHKCVVVPLGIELTPFLRISANKRDTIRQRHKTPIILFVGKFRYYKGLQYLIKAMEEIPGSLLVIGSGPMEQEWKNLSHSLHVDKKVTFLGEVGGDELTTYYQASDIFVLPACERSEAFGLVQVEAMASGLPVISTELGTGTSFVNVDGSTGLVIPPKDSGALKEAILSLIQNPSLREEMGRRGRERALREFSLETMGAKILDLYETVYSA